MELKNKLILLFFIFCLVAFIFIFLIFNWKSDNPSNLNNLGDDLDESSKIEENESPKTEELSNGKKESFSDNKIIMFHNGKGPMCLEALDFFEIVDYPLEQHLNYEPNFRELLNEYKSNFEKSEGVSESFGYYPIIFVNDKAYSGFNKEIGESIKRDLSG